MSSPSTQSPPGGHFVSVNGMDMYYEVHGEGPPLVLLHGFTGSTLGFQPFWSDFTPHFKLIVPEMRGHGRSTNPTNRFTFRQSALDIFALLDHLRIDSFRAIGASAGALTLLHMATQHPARVDAMVLVAGASYLPEQARALFAELTPDSDSWDWKALRQQHVRGDDQIRGLIDQCTNFADSYDDVNFTPPYLSTITASTLIVHGDRDEFFPVSNAVELYAAIPNAYLWIIPNGRHVAIWDKPPEVFSRTALKFLRGEWETA